MRPAFGAISEVGETFDENVTEGWRCLLPAAADAVESATLHRSPHGPDPLVRGWLQAPGSKPASRSVQRKAICHCGTDDLEHRTPFPDVAKGWASLPPLVPSIRTLPSPATGYVAGEGSM